MTEKECIQRILSGETELYSHFLEIYGNKVFALVSQIIQNQEDAEEITQDIFIKVFTSLHTFKGTCELSTWIYRIAYNTTISALRKKKIRNEIHLENEELEKASIDSLDQYLSTENDDEHEELIQDLSLAISWLTTEERTLISLFYYEEKSISECAYILKLSENNIKVRLHRARKKLSSYLYRIKYGNES